MKKISLIFLCFIAVSCAELQQVVNTLPNGQTGTTLDIAGGLRQALDMGIDKQVSKLTRENGFYGNSLVKILLPSELQKVDKTLRDIGLGSLADEGLKVLNRAAEDTVGVATPIFVNEVKQITFTDAKNILLGNNTAATSYLEGKTSNVLYSKFNPVIQNSFSKVGGRSGLDQYNYNLQHYSLCK